MYHLPIYKKCDIVNRLKWQRVIIIVILFPIKMSLDMQFPHTTWRIGAEHYFVYYNTKYMHFMRNQICLVVGCCWKYKTRANARL